MTIHYKVGDATKPEESPFLIVHCCNNIGGWGSGFVRAIDATFGYHVGDKYRRDHSKVLGDIQIVGVNGGWVCNLVGQEGVRSKTNYRPIRYTALIMGFNKINKAMKDFTWTPKPHIVMPRIGAGLAGGSWSIIERLIETELMYDVTVYDLPGAVAGEDWLL